MIEETL